MWPKVKEYLFKFYQSYLWIFVLLIGLDQATKLWAFTGKWDIELIPNFLYLYYTRNTGAAWSILEGNMFFLAMISAVVGTGIFVFRFLKRKELPTLKKIILAVILAGTWGNFIDRAFYKLMLGSEGVVDFIMFKFGNYIFPVFNVADICVTLGVISFAVLITVEDFKESKAGKEVASESEVHDETNDNLHE